MKIKKNIRLLSLILSVALLVSCLCACSSEEEKVAQKLSFKATLSYDYLKEIDGTQVEINGYLATSSPVDGSFIFLMNMPFQSCPFCVPNTTELSNTIEVYPKEGESFGYTNQAVKVKGKLVVAENADEPFTDQYGYQFSFKIVDAEYIILQAADLSEEMRLWQKFAQTDIVNEVYRMFDYVNFLCAWNTYYVNSYYDSNGNLVKGYYLYASDAVAFIEREGAQYNYGYQEGYFDSIIASIQKVDPTAFADLVAIVEQAEALADEAYGELKAGNYTYEQKYLEQFDNIDDVYTLNRGEELADRMNKTYQAFSQWLTNWEV